MLEFGELFVCLNGVLAVVAGDDVVVHQPVDLGVGVMQILHLRVLLRDVVIRLDGLDGHALMSAQLLNIDFFGLAVNDNGAGFLTTATAGYHGT